MSKHNRRDFLKMIAAGGAGAFLCSLGALRVAEPEPPCPALEPRPALYLCTPHLGHREAAYGEYWDQPNCDLLARLEALAQRARERLDAPWETPIFAHIVRSPCVDARTAQPCPPIESTLITGVGRRSPLIFTEPWGLEVHLDLDD